MASTATAWTLQIPMRSLSRRSFTVVVKSSGRRNATIIPTRVAAPSAPSPTAFDPAPEPAAPALPKRRILPSLIEPEVAQPEPEPVAVEEAPLPPKRPRGRPRKPRPVADEAVAAPFEAVAPPAPPVPQDHETTLAVPVATPLPPTPKLPRRAAAPAPSLDLSRGERWKRRLGRWSR